MTEQQRSNISNLGKSCQQAEDTLSQGMDKLQQMVLESVVAGQLKEQTNTPNMSTAMERLAGLVSFVNQIVIYMLIPYKGAMMLHSLKPVKQFSYHVCSFAIYSHDMSRQIETHHYCSRLNQDFLQCAVYDFDDANAHLLGVEYIIFDRIFEDLPDEEKKLWHSHAYEVKLGLLISPRVPEMIAMPELENLAKSYGTFWVPLGAPALMMSPQGVKPGLVRANLVHQRDAKYHVSSDSYKTLVKRVVLSNIMVLNI
ncbi:hypothetical protein AHAS_Ahas19G0119600 [Arachis hypogaea]